MERATGFEPVHRAWKARALPTELCPLIGGRGRAGILPRGFWMPEMTTDAVQTLQDRKAQIVAAVLTLHSCTEMLPPAQMHRGQDFEVTDQA